MRVQPLVFAGLLGSCIASAPVAYGPFQPRELAGRIAGAPQRCVRAERDIAVHPDSGDPNLLIYGLGKTIYANRLSRGCTLTQNLVLIPDSFGGSFCASDVVRSIDRSSRQPGPTCILSEWVPYTTP